MKSHSNYLYTLLTLFLLTACAPAMDSSPENIIVTDLIGREVAVPAEVDRVVAIGPGALRFYVYAGNLDYVVGVEQV